MDCVLAYDWSVMPCFVQLTLQTGVLDAAGLTALAEKPDPDRRLTLPRLSPCFGRGIFVFPPPFSCFNRAKHL